MQDRVQQLWVARGFRGCKGVYRGARQLLGDIGTWLFHLDRGSPRKVCLEDKNNIFRLYGVKKMGAEHFRAYLVIATEQVARARIVVGDLPVALVMEEMVGQASEGLQAFSDGSLCGRRKQGDCRL